MAINTSNRKWCWVSRQTKKGWRLSLCIGNKTFSVKGILLASEKEVRKITKHGNTVFVHLKNI